MPAQITTAIPKQNYELVTERIGEILAMELPNQATLNADTKLSPTVFMERTVTFNDEGLPALNVCFASGQYSNQSAAFADGMVMYNVDAYVASANTQDDRADALSGALLKRILGLCRFILSHPEYKTLGFAPGFIGSVNVQSITILDPGNTQDANAMLMGRLVLAVRMEETTTFQQPQTLATHVTTVTLHETELGYVWELINNNDDSGGSNS